MNISKSLFNLVKQTNVVKHGKFKAACSHHLSKMYSTEVSKEELVVKEKIQISRPNVKIWKRPPFVKEFFLGKFDTFLLDFPEILDHEHLADVEKYVKYLNNLYIQKVNSHEIDQTGKIPGDLIQDLKDMGLFGRMIPAKYGGLDLTYTACTRLNEVLGLDWSLYSMLTAHEFLASRVILLFGTEEQKDKYLPLLASGKLIAAFCASEFESGSDLISIKTIASENMDGTYCIRGSKCWVSNAEIADILIVFAKTPCPVDPLVSDVSVFIVDKNSDGIEILPHEKICLKGLKTSIVNFKDVIVPKENLIGDLKLGCHIYLKTMESFRIAMSTFTFGTLKGLLDSITDRIINTERIETSVGDLELVRYRLSRIACKIYAMESMAYFTSAILDSSENPDIAFESAILKIFNSEGTLYCIREFMELLGSTSLMKEQHLERFHRDALALLMFDGPNDVNRLFVGYAGCQYAGHKKAEVVKQKRNTLFFPKENIKLKIKRLRLFANKFKYDQDIAGHIHPSLVEWGNHLEEKLQMFDLAVEDVLSTHGAKVMETQLDPRKLADAAAYLYAQAAVLSRASRSYCIGLKNAHHEVRLCNTFCLDADNFLFQTMNEIFLGVWRNNEGFHVITGNQVIDCKGYFPEHPLKHNF